MYPKAGDQVLVRHTVPRFDTHHHLAQAKGMTNDALAFVPGPAGGFYTYSAENCFRSLTQDDFYSLDGWAAGGEGSFSVAGGEAVPSFVWPTFDNQWRGPMLTLDLGQDTTNVVAGVELNWLNNTTGALGRVVLDMLDAAGNILAAVAIWDPSSSLAYSQFRALLGSEASVNLNDTGSPVPFDLSTANPNSYGGWMGIRRVGSNWTWWTGAGVLRSATMSPSPVRSIRIRAQVFRSGGINWPAVASMAVRSLAVLTDASNEAALGLALAGGGAGFEAFTANAFDGNTATNFVSQLTGSDNYGGGTFLGQSLPVASRYPRLGFVEVRNSTNSTSYHPSSGRILFADEPGGPWETVASYSGLSQAGGVVNVLPLPVGLAGRRCWRFEPTSGLGSNVWTPAELLAYYGQAQVAPSQGVSPYFAQGAWTAAVPAGLGGAIGSYLAW